MGSVLSRNQNAIPLLKQNKAKINWKYLSSNSSIFAQTPKIIIQRLLYKI